ncbi:MAG: carboxypeptidase-like regulatory domain-containing protein [Acidobacteriota bacterium]|nr:carboxypeptidase-like regulatory domain-containing protein [Acidobacteriota bacterium]
MKLRRVQVMGVLLLLLLLASLCFAAGKKKNAPPEQFCSVSFVVLRDFSGKPIKNASVIVHGVKKDGEQEVEGFQLKTDGDGHAHMEDLPYGKYRVQVIVRSLQTYGEDYDFRQAQLEITIRMKQPAGQLTIY